MLPSQIRFGMHVSQWIVVVLGKNSIFIDDSSIGVILEAVDHYMIAFFDYSWGPHEFDFNGDGDSLQHFLRQKFYASKRRYVEGNGADLLKVFRKHNPSTSKESDTFLVEMIWCIHYFCSHRYDLQLEKETISSIVSRLCTLIDPVENFVFFRNCALHIALYGTLAFQCNDRYGSSPKRGDCSEDLNEVIRLWSTSISEVWSQSLDECDLTPSINRSCDSINSTLYDEMQGLCLSSREISSQIQHSIDSVDASSHTVWNTFASPYSPVASSSGHTSAVSTGYSDRSSRSGFPSKIAPESWEGDESMAARFGYVMDMSRSRTDSDAVSVCSFDGLVAHAAVSGETCISSEACIASTHDGTCNQPPKLEPFAADAVPKYPFEERDRIFPSDTTRAQLFISQSLPMENRYQHSSKRFNKPIKQSISAPSLLPSQTQAILQPSSTRELPHSSGSLSGTGSGGVSGFGGQREAFLPRVSRFSALKELEDVPTASSNGSRTVNSKLHTLSPLMAENDRGPASPTAALLHSKTRGIFSPLFTHAESNDADPMSRGPNTRLQSACSDLAAPPAVGHTAITTSIYSSSGMHDAGTVPRYTPCECVAPSAAGVPHSPDSHKQAACPDSHKQAALQQCPLDFGAAPPPPLPSSPQNSRRHSGRIPPLAESPFFWSLCTAESPAAENVVCGGRHDVGSMADRTDDSYKLSSDQEGVKEKEEKEEDCDVFRDESSTLRFPHLASPFVSYVQSTVIRRPSAPFPVLPSIVLPSADRSALADPAVYGGGVAVSTAPSVLMSVESSKTRNNRDGIVRMATCPKTSSSAFRPFRAVSRLRMKESGVTESADPAIAQRKRERSYDD